VQRGKSNSGLLVVQRREKKILVFRSEQEKKGKGKKNPSKRLTSNCTKETKKRKGAPISMIPRKTLYHTGGARREANRTSRLGKRGSTGNNSEGANPPKERVFDSLCKCQLKRLSRWKE